MVKDNTPRNCEGVADIYSSIAEVVGFEYAYKLYEEFRGQQICFPKKFYKTEYIAKQIVQQYDGKNLRELAQKYDYTERYLRKIISKYTK